MNYNKIQINIKYPYTPLDIKNTNKLIIEKISEIESYKIKTFDNINYTNTKISKIEQSTCTWKEVYKLEINEKLNFIPGDSIGLLCPNNLELVDEILNILNMSDGYYFIKQIGRPGFEYQGSLKDFFLYIFDFTSLPKKSFLYDISKLSKKRSEIEFLCSKEGTKEYLNIINNWYNIIDILKYSDCKINLEDLLMNCQIIKPRYYSLTNKKEEKCQILVGTVIKKFDNFVRYGHVSDFVHNNKIENLKICLRESKLIRIGDTNKILCICTGTGVAPFISFIKNKEERQILKIIYGFRNKEDDLLSNESISKNTEIIRVMSSNKKYVTDYITENIQNVYEFIRNDCLVYVCGRPEMQKKVYEIFSEKYEDVVKEKRLLFDSWL